MDFRLYQHVRFGAQINGHWRWILGEQFRSGLWVIRYADLDLFHLNNESHVLAQVLSPWIQQNKVCVKAKLMRKQVLIANSHINFDNYIPQYNRSLSLNHTCSSTCFP